MPNFTRREEKERRRQRKAKKRWTRHDRAMGGRGSNLATRVQQEEMERRRQSKASLHGKHAEWACAAVPFQRVFQRRRAGPTMTHNHKYRSLSTWP